MAETKQDNIDVKRTMMRPSKDQYYINIAKVVNTRSTCLSTHYGAVIVNNDEIVATGYNGAARGETNCCDAGQCYRKIMGCKRGERYELCRALHAEDNAITSAGRTRCKGATLYLAGQRMDTGEIASPTLCLMCARKVMNSGISRVVGLFPDGDVAEIDVKKCLTVDHLSQLSADDVKIV